MGVRKRGNIYHYEFEYKGVKYRGTTGETSKTAANAVEAKVREEVKHQVKYGKLPEVTWGEVVERYLKTVIAIKKSTSDKSKNSTVSRLDSATAYIGEDTFVSDITSASIHEYRDGLLMGKYSTSGGALKTGSVGRILDDVRAILTKCHEEWGYLNKPVKVKSPKKDEGRDREMSKDEEARLMQHLAPHLKDFLIFVVNTGARKSEALQLTWRDVHLEHGTPHVVLKLTKTDQPRTIPLPLKAIAMLKQRIESAEEAEIFGEDLNVLTYQGESLADPKKGWKSACKKAEVKDLTMHDIRHTYACRMVREGVSIPQLQMLLGHKSVRMTMRYARLVPEDIMDVGSLLD